MKYLCIVLWQLVFYLRTVNVDLYLAIFLILLSLPLTVFLMVWLRGGIRSRSDVIGGFKISLKVVGALTGVLFVTMVLVEISELLLG